MYMRDLVFVSLERWDEVWRRNQFLCAQWLRRFPRMRLLFVEPARDLSHAFRSGRFEHLRKSADEHVAEFPGLTIFRPLKLCPNSLALGRVCNQALLRFQIQAAMRRAAVRSPILWINDHFAGSLCGSLGERGVIYDITDDWRQFPSTSAAERVRVEEADRLLCARADAVVVCSEALEKSRRALCRRMVRIPNAVDAAHYARCVESSHGRNPADRCAAPVFGYAGTLHGDRLAVDLLVHLASEFPHGQVVLCGPDHLSAEERKVLQTRSNIQIRPPVPYSRMPDLLSEFDVFLVPHRQTPFTESLNPIKLWEYLAAGKPIAATPVAGFRDYAHLCHLGQGPAEFVSACHAALAEGSRLQRERIRVAEAHSWENRAEDALDLFRQEGWIGAPMRRNRLREKRRVSLAGGLRRVFWRETRTCTAGEEARGMG
jgi:glycosyltransferase involved in cell wall biosynthesis